MTPQDVHAWVNSGGLLVLGSWCILKAIGAGDGSMAVLHWP